MSALWRLSVEAFRGLLREELDAAAERQGRTTTALIGMSELADQLGVHPRTVDELVTEGCPHVDVEGRGDPRFELWAVLDWLRDRGQR